ncbi:MAG: carbohydrate kinase [Planctomycetota bacterium]|nr:MAG: carbohydrate kinase [Planctomycetota bacterium]
MSDPRLNDLAAIIDAQGADLSQARVVAGFDGFVDEMIQVVGERQSLEHFDAVSDIPAFAAWVAGAAGRSSLKEVVVQRQDAGGCAVNLGDGLVTFGIQLDLFATLGAPIAAPFAPLVARCHHAESWCSQPGRTLAFEFNDGKLMFASVSQLGELDPAAMERAIADGQLRPSCQAAQLIALTNWTLYPHMTACWQVFQQQVLAQCQQSPLIFIDLVDPRSRSRADISAMLETLPRFQDHGRAILGVNLNEANAVADLLGIAQVEEDGPAMAEQAAAIRQKLGIHQVVTHAVKVAAAADAHSSAIAAGPFCAKPDKSVGAGDRFNAGYCAAQLLGLNLEQSLLLGNASSGFFVRQARSATVSELAQFCRDWQAGNI